MLAQLLRAADKPAIFSAGRQIERRLSRKPLKTGEGRTANTHRIAFFRPLVVVFTVDRVSRTVVVERVGWVGN
jgi:hypothetical protein